MRESGPLGALPRNGEPFYFDDGSDSGTPDYVYGDGASLSCADYRDAVLVMRGVRPGDSKRRSNTRG
jgi:hypothetical protein